MLLIVANCPGRLNIIVFILIAQRKSSEEEILPRQTRAVDFNVYMNNLGLAHSSGSSANPGAAQRIGTDEKRPFPSQSCCPPLV